MEIAESTASVHQNRQGDAYRTKTPKRLASAGDPRFEQRAFAAWRKHLAGRKRPGPLADVLPGSTHALLWNLPDDVDIDAVRDIVSIGPPRNNGHSKGNAAAELAVNDWLASCSESSHITAAVTALAWGYALLPLASRISMESWWQLYDALRAIALTERDSVDVDIDPKVAWRMQLLQGELGNILASYFAELAESDSLQESSSATCTEVLLTITDGEGLPHAQFVPWLRPLLASWVRCLAVADAASVDPWSDDAQTQLDWMARQAVRLSRSDGSQLLGSGSKADWCSDLFKHLLRMVGDEEDAAAARSSLPKNLKLASSRELPCEPAVNSEWSGISVLRTDFRRGSPRIAVDYHQHDVELEIESGRQMLIAGEWGLEVRFNGKSLEQEDEWEEVCWFSDDDVDYLELSAPLNQGGRVDRQILLGREDRVALLIDNIANLPYGKIEYESTLPVPESVQTLAAEETREVVLAADKPVALAMPLALPEWRIDTRLGELTIETGCLQLRQNLQGAAMCCPLFFDLRPQRFTKKRTWRQLTVAEALEICMRDQAVGFRVQCAGAQWLFYRSLAPPGNRTVLGQNYSSEFFAGQFHPDGEVHELIEIEGT